MNFETSQKNLESEKKKLKQKLTNLRSDLKEKDVYLKNKLRVLEDRCRRNNIRLEGIPGSEIKGWDVMEEKLKKVIKYELDIQNVVIERAQRVKRNNDNNENNDLTNEPPTVVAKLLNFIGKQDILHEAKSRKIRNFYFKENFPRETLAIRKRLWNEVVRLQEEEGKFAVVNYDRIYSRSFRPRK